MLLSWSLGYGVQAEMLEVAESKAWETGDLSWNLVSEIQGESELVP